jgi:hypothetical protein
MVGCWLELQAWGRGWGGSLPPRAARELMGRHERHMYVCVASKSQ